MALFKKNKFNFFKGLYLLLVLAIMDIALIYSFLVPGELGRNYDAIGFFFILNVGFIYVNFDVILIIYKYMRKHTFRDLFSLIVKYKSDSKPSGLFCYFRVFIGGSFIVWAILSDTSVILKLIVILLGIYNIWRSI